MPLFIGGPLDGKLINVSDYEDTVQVAVEVPMGNTKVTDIFYYKRETLECPSTQIPVFVPRAYKCSDTILALINGYHQNALQNENNE
jgi:hypothetical protein